MNPKREVADRLRKEIWKTIHSFRGELDFWDILFVLTTVIAELGHHKEEVFASLERKEK